ncbi:MAG TPA: STN domain-containing protein, partial [Rhizomicrobium sp.]|nr:STN domain-containing protein [Rhizomicrobium sp.]
MRSPKFSLFGAMGLLALSGAALAQGAVSIPAEDLKNALDDYIRQSGVQLIYNVDDVTGVVSNEVRAIPAEAALGRMLGGTGLLASRDKSGAIIIARLAGRHIASGAEPQTLESVVVTGTRIRDDD